MRKLALVHSLLTLSPLPLQRRPSGPTGGLAPPRPRGTAAGTDVKPGDERRRADCFLLLKHYMVGVVVQWQPPIEGVEVEGRGREGVSIEPRTRTGASWDVVEEAMMSEWRNHLHSACRPVSLVDDAARGDPGGQGNSASGIPTRIASEQHRHCHPSCPCKAHVGDVVLECADE